MIKVSITKNHEKNYDKLFKLLNKGRRSTTTQINSINEYREGEKYIVEFNSMSAQNINAINLLNDMEVIVPSE